jgi:hypothetical protein
MAITVRFILALTFACASLLAVTPASAQSGAFANSPKVTLRLSVIANRLRGGRDVSTFKEMHHEQWSSTFRSLPVRVDGVGGNLTRRKYLRNTTVEAIEFAAQLMQAFPIWP